MALPSMSRKGLPAMFTLGAMTILFLVAVGIVDYAFAARGGSDDYTMTYGLRWLYFNVPLAAASIIFIAGMIIGALFTHLAGYLYVGPVNT